MLRGGCTVLLRFLSASYTSASAKVLMPALRYSFSSCIHTFIHLFFHSITLSFYSHYHSTVIIIIILLLVLFVFSFIRFKCVADSVTSDPYMNPSCQPCRAVLLFTPSIMHINILAQDMVGMQQQKWKFHAAHPQGYLGIHLPRYIGCLACPHTGARYRCGTQSQSRVVLEHTCIRARSLVSVTMPSDKTSNSGCGR